MSSKIFEEGQDQQAAPPVWRQVPAGDDPPGPATDSGVDVAGTLARFQQQCEERVSQARSAGLREGEAAGRRDAAAEVQPVIERLTRTIEELSGMRPRLRKEAEGDVLRLAMAIARRVLRREMAIDPEALHGLVVAALEKMGGQEVSRVRVHPSQAAQVSAALGKTASGTAVEVLADPAREPGTLIFETERGNLDCSVESQLVEIERGLTDRLRRNS